MKRLVVTADDFGAACEVNQAVEIAHTRGILTATSLMVAAPAADEAVSIARRLPSLRVGLHIVLVEGRPMLPPSQVPDLVDSTGRFRTDMAMSGAKMFFFPSIRRQLTREIEAQFEAFRATGLSLDHVNAHKHFHLHPTIAAEILRIGKGFGMRSLRVPREPHAVLAEIESLSADPTSVIAATWSALLARRLKASDVATPDQVFGLRWSGAMTRNRVKALLDRLPDGLTEIYLHPATGPYAGSAPGYRYSEELAALTDREVVRAGNQTGVARGGFSDFV
ncbi:MAG TPA: hopanoid biosynthesis-associated protein HpnK [Rhizomicrobium sp.]|nr:hopanoid biosynthesis-associated protein HpnK [Rhizomicrobium sp.]